MTDPSSPAITAVDVRKSFGDNVVLDGPDLAVARNYREGQWISRERERLTNAIEPAAGEDTGTEERAV